jgi:hypothetical protein
MAKLTVSAQLGLASAGGERMTKIVSDSQIIDDPGQCAPK